MAVNYGATSHQAICHLCLAQMLETHRTTKVKLARNPKTPDECRWPRLGRDSRTAPQ